MKVYQFPTNRNRGETYVDTARKSLLVRADFILDRSRGGDRLTFKRWRRVLADALPRLLGCADRCPRAVVRLHRGEVEGRFSGWLRIPVERRPGRKRLRKIRAKLHDRLESALLPVGGEVVKVGVRRCRARAVPAAPLLPFPAQSEPGPQLQVVSPC
jgi:hypothetical protein